MRKREEPEEAAVLALITPVQQTFIEHLLTGKSISMAARMAGISRRTAMYWLADEKHPVRVEYDKQRDQALAEFDRQVASIHSAALSALEDLLSEHTPPFIRVQALRLIYEDHLRDHLGLRAPGHAASMVCKEAEEYHGYDDPQKRLGIFLWDDKGKPRIND